MPSRNTCHRSTHAWPVLLAWRADAEVFSLSCSGARLADVAGGAASQAARLARAAGVRLVTVTVGGNDVGFAGVLRRCATRLRCDRYYANHGRDLLRARIGTLARRLPGAYAAIRRAAPSARVVIVGYPRLFPPRPSRFTCAALSSIGPEEIRYLNARVADLDLVVGDRARAAGAGYLDVLDAFAGHAVGCTGAQWVNHFSPTHLTYSFHPNAAGHRRLADLVERWLRRTPSGG